MPRRKSKRAFRFCACRGCGAALAFDPKRQALSCSFCDGIVEIETVVDPMEQTEGYLPFTATRQDAQAALRTWLGALGWFRPSDLVASSRIHELRPLWWVAWVFEADTQISWAADSNAGARRSSWAPHAGQTKVRFQDVLASASRGLSAKEVDAVCGGLNLKTVQSSPVGIEDGTVEQFDVPRSQARQSVRASLEAFAADHVKRHEIPGSSFRKVHVSVVVQGLVTRRLALPAYVLAYRYRDQLYRVVICGQDVRHLTGTAPYSKAKIFLAIAIAAVLFALMLVAIGAS